MQLYKKSRYVYKRRGATSLLLFIRHEAGLYERVEKRKILWFKYYKGFGPFIEPDDNFYYFDKFTVF